MSARLAGAGLFLAPVQVFAQRLGFPLQAGGWHLAGRRGRNAGLLLFAWADAAVIRQDVSL